MNRKITSFMSAVALAVTSFAILATACFAGEPSGTLNRIKSGGALMVGVRASSVPFSMLDDSGNPSGFTVELCSKIFDDVKREFAMPDLKVKYVLVKSGDRIQKLLDGEIDIECGSTTNTKERSAQVAFANTIFITSSRIVTRAGMDIKRVDDLKGRKVAIAQNASVAPIITRIDLERKLDIQYVRVKDFAEGFQFVESKRVDAFVSDDIQFAEFIGSSSHPADFVVVGEPLSVDPLGIMLRKDDAQFLSIANHTLNDLVVSGEFTRIYNKWFMSKKLKFPMAESLKKLLKTPNNTPNY